MATQAETCPYRAVQFYGLEFLTRTGVMIIMGIIAGSVRLGLRARSSWLMTLLLTAGCTGFVLTLALALNMRFPGGLLQDLHRLLWPFS